MSRWRHDFDSPAADIAMRVFTFLGSFTAIIGGVGVVAAAGGLVLVVGVLALGRSHRPGTAEEG